MNFSWSHRGREENINFLESMVLELPMEFPGPLCPWFMCETTRETIFTLMIYRTTGSIHKNIPKCGQWSDEHDPAMHAKRLQLSENVTDEGKLITGCYQWPDGNLTFLPRKHFGSYCYSFEFNYTVSGRPWVIICGVTRWKNSRFFMTKIFFTKTCFLKIWWNFFIILMFFSHKSGFFKILIFKNLFASHGHPRKHAAQGNTETEITPKAKSLCHIKKSHFSDISTRSEIQRERSAENIKKTISINICMWLYTIRGRFERICLETCKQSFVVSLFEVKQISQHWNGTVHGN